MLFFKSDTDLFRECFENASFSRWRRPDRDESVIWWRQPDFYTACASIIFAIVFGAVSYSVGARTEITSLGFPPWGNTSGVMCDGGECILLWSNETEPADMWPVVASYVWRRQHVASLDRIAVWCCYAAHQFSSWACLFIAQRLHGNKRYVSKLRAMNIWALVMNASFVSIHILHSATTFSSLSQDISFWSAQVCSILIIVIAIVIDNQSRGVFLGKRLPLADGAAYLLRRYHGYAVSYLIILSFWYHPVMATSGHAIGVAHSVLLLTHSSLFYTRLHLNPYWRLLLEGILVLHALPLASSPFALFTLLPPDPSSWKGFLLGLLLVFATTQCFALPQWRLLSPKFRFLPLLCCLVLFLAVYQPSNFEGAASVLLLPALLYLGALLYRSLLLLVCWLATLVSSRDFSSAQPTLLATFSLSMERRAYEEQTAAQLEAEARRALEKDEGDAAVWDARGFRRSWGRSWNWGWKTAVGGGGVGVLAGVVGFSWAVESGSMNGDAVGGLLVAGTLAVGTCVAVIVGAVLHQDQGVPLRRKTIEAMADDVMASGGQPEGGRRDRKSVV